MCILTAVMAWRVMPTHKSPGAGRLDVLGLLLLSPAGAVVYGLTLIYGAADRDAGAVAVKDMDSGEQAQVPADELAAYLSRRCATSQ